MYVYFKAAQSYLLVYWCTAIEVLLQKLYRCSDRYCDKTAWKLFVSAAHSHSTRGLAEQHRRNKNDDACRRHALPKLARAERVAAVSCSERAFFQTPCSAFRYTTAPRTRHFKRPLPSSRRLVEAKQLRSKRQAIQFSLLLQRAEPRRHGDSRSRKSLRVAFERVSPRRLRRVRFSLRSSV